MPGNRQRVEPIAQFLESPPRARQMSAKPAKRRKSAANGRFFAETAIPFALPSLPQPAYPDASGMPVCAGTGGSITFFDSAETT
jgi:hypothetical protein